MDIDNTFNGLPKIENPVSSLDFSWLRNELHSLYQLRNDVAFMRSFNDSLTQMNEMMRQIHLSREQMLGNISSSLLDLSRQLKELNPLLCSCSLAQAAENALDAIEKDEDEAILSQHVETLETYMGEISFDGETAKPSDKRELEERIFRYVELFLALLSVVIQCLPNPDIKDLVRNSQQQTAIMQETQIQDDEFQQKLLECMMDIKVMLEEQAESSDQMVDSLDSLNDKYDQIILSFDQLQTSIDHIEDTVEDVTDSPEFSNQQSVSDAEDQDLESVENADHTEQ